ncbi:MAG: efflux RND transporter periplasmic adaptor subunit [Gammaproteobacteria bacterium]|nr:efflux RND transporter periplasmic adaptor subunit [Gammaproteobacteria bacterium]
MKILSRYPWIISLFLILSLATWLATGLLQAAPEKNQPKPATTPVPKVRVQKISPQKVHQSIILYGRTEPSRSTVLRAELSGRITEIYATRGQRIKKNAPVMRLDLNDRDKQLIYVEARLAQHKLEFEGSKSLSLKGYQGKAQLAQSQADLKETEARIAQLKKEIKNTLLRAPFDGVIYDRTVELGDYITVGEQLADFIDLNPLIVRGNVSQQNIQSIYLKQKALVTFAGNIKKTGKVHYISSMSNTQTNTFRIEVSLDNPDLKILAGLTTEIEIPLKQIDAIKISPALFSLDENGVIGIKWVKHNTVQFSTIDVIKTEADGVWIKALDPDIKIITVGQAFVRKGDKVDAVLEHDNIADQSS